MGATLEFSGVSCGTIAGLSFALEAGQARVLHVADRDEKTAVIELSIGERSPEAGTVTLNGAALDAAAPGSLGWVPEHGGLISNLKAWENITLPLWYHGQRHPADTEASAVHWLAVLGVEGDAMERYLASPAAYLTSLERKRTGLLRGLLLAPRVLVADAALFYALPQGVRASWAAALDALAAGAGKSSVLVVAAEGDVALPWIAIE